jgi:hypothetical protein
VLVSVSDDPETFRACRVVAKLLLCTEVGLASEGTTANGYAVHALRILFVPTAKYYSELSPPVIPIPTHQISILRCTAKYLLMLRNAQKEFLPS